MSLSRCLRPLLLLPRLCGLPVAPPAPPKCTAQYRWHRCTSSDAHTKFLFEKKVDEALELLCDQVEEVLSRSQRITDYDVSLSSGVLTVNLGELGTYVINKQSANQQIWLSSPVSGPKRYDLSHDEWIYQRDSRTLDQLLSQELAALLQEPVQIKLH